MRKVKFNYIMDLFKNKVVLIEDVTNELYNVFEKGSKEVYCYSIPKFIIGNAKGEELKKGIIDILNKNANGEIRLFIQTFEKDFWEDCIIEFKKNKGKNLVIVSMEQ